MFLKNPNFPESKVNTVLIDDKVSIEIKDELSRLGLNYVEIKSHPKLMGAVSSHPDMNILHLGGNRFLTDNYFDKSVLPSGSEVLISHSELRSDYPFDILFNVCIIGKRAVLFSDNPSSLFLSGYELLKVRQGYSKCSIIPVTENSAITDDPGIFRKLKECGLDVLLVSKGSVRLAQFDYGFIGGTCGFIDKNKLCFYGDVSKHENGKEIISFLKNYGIEAISLSNGVLYDYGSILPITEEGNDKIC